MTREAKARTMLAYKMKTTIHADGKLGVEDPGERAKAGT